MARTSEWDLKISELDVHGLTLQDTVSYNRKNEELLVVLRSLQDSTTAEEAAKSMQMHLPLVYKALIQDRADHIAQAVVVSGGNTTFLLVSLAIT